MSFRQKFILVFLVATTIPVFFSGILSVRTAGGEMMQKTADYQEKTASVAADAIDKHFREALSSLRMSTELIPFDQFPETDLPDALRIPYRQFDFVNAVALLDSNGRLLTRTIYESNPDAIDKSSHRQTLDSSEVKDFVKRISIDDTLAYGHRFSPVYVSERTNTSKIALSISFPVHQTKEKWILAVELSFLAMDDQVKGLAPEQGMAVIVDGGNRIVSPERRGWVFAKRSIVTRGFRQKRAVSDVYNVAGNPTMGVFSPIPFLGWGLIIEQPARVALKSVHRIRNHTILWTGLGIIVAILGGLLLGKGISRPIIELSDKARQLAAGLFDSRIAIHSKDEIGQLANSFNNMSYQLEKRIEQLEKLFYSSTRTLVAAVEAKDRYTAGHSERVTAYALALCDEMGLDGRDRSIVEISGLLHDVGKIGVPESILNKPGSLVPGEFATIQHHPVQGYEIVKKIDHPFAEEVALAVRTHHERYDGRGYPDELAAEEISEVARILTVADAFDAMTSSRAYRKGLHPDEAIRRLKECAGTQFDPTLVEAFTHVYQTGKLDDIYNSAKTVPPANYPHADTPVSESPEEAGTGTVS